MSATGITTRWPLKSSAAVVGSLACSALIAIYTSPFWLQQLGIILSYAFVLLGLHLLTGLTGQISLGQGVFFAVGAYMTVVLADGLGVVLAMLLAALVTAVVATLVALPVMRFTGFHLALATLGLSVLLPPLVKRFPDVTGGALGLQLDPIVAPVGSVLASDQWLFVAAVTSLTIVTLLVRRVRHQYFGLAMQTVAHSPILATALGISVYRTKVRAFAGAGVLAGLGGAFFAVSSSYISPDSFPLMLSVMFLAGCVIGGMKYITGALVGAAFLFFVPDWSQSINQSVPGVVFGGLIVLTMLIAPNGILGSVISAIERLRPSR